jgi:hypothetical protein
VADSVAESLVCSLNPLSILLLKELQKRGHTLEFTMREFIEVCLVGVHYEVCRDVVKFQLLDRQDG